MAALKLIAGVMVKNELRRYLPLSVASLLKFCDEVRVVDDGSDDGSREWLATQDHVVVLENRATHFDEHEGRARQLLLDWVRDGEPSHVLVIDADEFVSDGVALRASLMMNPTQPAWTLEMQEIWKADEQRLWIRIDNLWKPSPVPILWRAAERGELWKIRDRALACGREPEAIRGLRPIDSGVAVLHFGWTNLSERQRRYDRYMAIDGGRFHASGHLRSIMWPDRRVQLRGRHWPDMNREQMLARVREDRP